MKKFLLLTLTLVFAMAVFAACDEAILDVKEDQTALVITAVTGKRVGDDAFQLEVTGGSGTGAVTFTRESGTAATVSSTGLVTIASDGKITVTATKAGDDDYNPVTSAALELTIAASPLFADIEEELDTLTTDITTNYFNKFNQVNAVDEAAIPNEDWYIKVASDITDLASLTIGSETFADDQIVPIGIGLNSFVRRPAFFVDAEGDLYIAVAIANFESVGGMLRVGNYGSVKVGAEENYENLTIASAAKLAAGTTVGHEVTLTEEDGIQVITLTRTAGTNGYTMIVTDTEDAPLTGITEGVIAFSKSNTATIPVYYSISSCAKSAYTLFGYGVYFSGPIEEAVAFEKMVTFVLRGEGVVSYLCRYIDVVPA